MKNRQQGFTLIEIAIVLVVIGLLLGGVLKGQELINSAKVKNLANDFRSIPLFIHGYQDKFKRLPGDDPNADTRFTGGVIATTTGHIVGDGKIAGTWNSAVLTDENVLFWQHVRLSGLASGSTDFSTSALAGLPSNTEGGVIGIQMTPPIDGLMGSYYVCSNGINNKLAQQLDSMLDDGAGTTGSLRAQEGATTNPAANGAAYQDGKSYSVCQAF